MPHRLPALSNRVHDRLGTAVSGGSSAGSMRGIGAPISAALRRRAPISRSSESMVSRSRIAAACPPHWRGAIHPSVTR
jgi:hypothetical protein